MTLKMTKLPYISGIILMYLFCFSDSISALDELVYPCPCADKNNCDPVSDWNKDKREVIVVSSSDKSKDFSLWKTDSFTSVIEWADGFNKELMCYTHSLGKKYGIYLGNIPLNHNSTSSEVMKFIDTTREDIALHHADMLALGLIDLLGDCDYASHHVEGISTLVKDVIHGIKQDGKLTKVLCVMPWQPPCMNSNCGINPVLAAACDGLILSPESYNIYCDESCTAKATMSYGKMVFGITEYLATGWNASQILMGIPWHGYNYTCDTTKVVAGLENNYICHLKMSKDADTNKTTCNLEGSRQRIGIDARIMTPDGPEELGLARGNFSKADMSPWMVNVVNNGTVEQTYLTWYEDIGSLMRKYEIVHEMGLRGSVIFTADDLTYTNMGASKQFNDNMWAWILHSILAANPPQKKEANLNQSGMMAGIGVGMFVLGTLLGVIFSCIVFRRKKGLRAPFSRDPLADEFRDDDDHNQL